jgi:hypothetical protein
MRGSLHCGLRPSVEMTLRGCAGDSVEMTLRGCAGDSVEMTLRGCAGDSVGMTLRGCAGDSVEMTLRGCAGPSVEMTLRGCAGDSVEMTVCGRGEEPTRARATHAFDEAEGMGHRAGKYGGFLLPQPASSHPSEQVHRGSRSWPGTPFAALRMTSKNEGKGKPGGPRTGSPGFLRRVTDLGRSGASRLGVRVPGGRRGRRRRPWRRCQSQG